MNDCIFCKITNKEIPHYPVYEDNDILAFLDAYPLAPGHVLVVPKQHYSSFMETPESIREKVFHVAHTIIPFIQKATAAPHVFLLVAGIDVHHFHLHLIPQTDTPSVLAGAKPISVTPAELETMRFAIVENFPI